MQKRLKEAFVRNLTIHEVFLLYHSSLQILVAVNFWIVEVRLVYVRFFPQ